MRGSLARWRRIAVLVRPANDPVLSRIAGLWLLGRRRFGAARRARARQPDRRRRRGRPQLRSHGRFVLVASEGGVTFWTGNHPLRDRRRRPGGEPASEAREHRRCAPRYPELERRRDGADLLSRGIRVDPRTSSGLARARGAESLLSARAVGPSYSASFDALRRGVRRVVRAACCRSRSSGCCGCAAASGRTPGLWLLAASAVVGLSRLLPAGTLPHSGDRSGAQSCAQRGAIAFA